jgi:hypothetical protein
MSSTISFVSFLSFLFCHPERSEGSLFAVAVAVATPSPFVVIPSAARDLHFSFLVLTTAPASGE